MTEDPAVCLLRWYTTLDIEDKKMKLIVGLGNPGKEYEKTRHNSGFMAMDYLSDKMNVSITTKKWNALIGKGNVNGEQVLLMKPMTYMNESGNAVIQAVNFHKIAVEDILVIHDDMDLPTGALRIRKKGSAGGQKGMKSIISHLGTSDFARIRIGVGHSNKGDHSLVTDWVLSPVPKAEQADFEHTLKMAADAAYAWIDQPMDLVMNNYNIKK